MANEAWYMGVQSTKINDPLVGELATERLQLVVTTTREESALMGRITNLLQSGEVYRELDTEPLNPTVDRVMICGSVAMLKDVRTIVEEAGFKEGANSAPGEFVVERAFVG